MGPDNTVRFTHLSSTSVNALQKLWASSAEQSNSNSATTQVTEIGVLDLMKSNNIPLEKVCLLDPKATQGLSPEDGDGRFEWFLFGVRNLLFLSTRNRLLTSVILLTGYPWRRPASRPNERTPSSRLPLSTSRLGSNDHRYSSGSD